MQFGSLSEVFQKRIALRRVYYAFCRCLGKMSGLIVNRFCQYSTPVSSFSNDKWGSVRFVSGNED